MSERGRPGNGRLTDQDAPHIQWLLRQPEAWPGGAIVCRDVAVGYEPGQLVLRNVTLGVGKHELVFLVGSNGAGKSTLLRLILGALQPESGCVLVNGRDVGAFGRNQRSEHRRHLGTVFQDMKLFPRLTVAENVAFALRVNTLDDQLIEYGVKQALEIVGAGDLAHRKPDQLSGGEQRLVAIARAIAPHPSILLADEPTANLEEDMALRVMHVLAQINRLGATVVVATHSRELVNRLRRRVVGLHRGMVVYDAPRSSYPQGLEAAENIWG